MSTNRFNKLTLILYLIYSELQLSEEWSYHYRDLDDEGSDIFGIGLLGGKKTESTFNERGSRGD